MSKISHLNKLAEKCHKDAQSLGWYADGKVKTDLETLMMVVTEISEAVEELRKENPKIEYYDDLWDSVPLMSKSKPEGYGVEIADAIIRLLDFCAYKKIDIEGIINRKLEYNLTRGYRHGNKRF